MRDDFADFRNHPEWFDTVMYCPPLPNPLMKARAPQDYQAAIDAYANPPIIIRRKPIPFVLPIKGSAL